MPVDLNISETVLDMSLQYISVSVQRLAKIRIVGVSCRGWLKRLPWAPF